MKGESAKCSPQQAELGGERSFPSTQTPKGTALKRAGVMTLRWAKKHSDTRDGREPKKTHRGKITDGFPNCFQGHGAPKPGSEWSNEGGRHKGKTGTQTVSHFESSLVSKPTCYGNGWSPLRAESWKPLCLLGNISPPISKARLINLSLPYSFSHCRMQQGYLFFPGLTKPVITQAESPAQGGQRGLVAHLQDGEARPGCPGLQSRRLAACAGIYGLARPPPHLQLQPPLATPGGPHEVIPRRSSALGASRGGRRSSPGGRPPHLPAAPDTHCSPAWRLIFCERFCTPGIAGLCKKREGTDRLSLSLLPVLPCHCGCLDSSIWLCGFPSLSIFLISTVHFAEFEGWLSIEINSQILRKKKKF